MSRDPTLYIDDMIEAGHRVQHTERLGGAQFVSGTMAHDASLRRSPRAARAYNSRREGTLHAC